MAKRKKRGNRRTEIDLNILRNARNGIHRLLSMVKENQSMVKHSKNL